MNFCVISIWTSPFYILIKELYSIFIRRKSSMEIQGEPLSQGFLNLPDRALELLSTNLLGFSFSILFILTWNAFLALVELLVVFTLNFCPVFLFNLSHKNFLTFSHRALERAANKIWTSPFFLFSYIKHRRSSTWTSGYYPF